MTGSGWDSMSKTTCGCSKHASCAARNSLPSSKAREGLEKVDLLFSPFISRSEVAKLRHNEIKIEDCDPLVQEVWQLCLAAKAFTEGAFDPWAVKGGFDPSGYVKGWAADKCIEILKKHGATSIQVNAAGDISLAGGFEGGPWKIGIRHPDDAETIVKVFEMTHAAHNGGKGYQNYTLITPFEAENQEALKEYIDKYLEELITIINEPVCECDKCNGTGVLLNKKDDTRTT